MTLKIFSLNYKEKEGQYHFTEKDQLVEFIIDLGEISCARFVGKIGIFIIDRNGYAWIAEEHERTYRFSAKIHMSHYGESMKVNVVDFSPIQQR